MLDGLGLNVVRLVAAAVIMGSITGGDPSHPNFVNFAGGGPSVCGPTPTYPGTITDSSTYHYDTYTATNTTGSPVCVTATVDATG
jgi:hypothetical protein